MTYPDDFERQHPRAEDIQLTDQNTTLHDQLLEGIRNTLTGDFTHLFEVKEKPVVYGDVGSKKEKHLARAAIMSVPGISNGPDGELIADETPMLHVVARADLAHLDQEEARELTEDEAEELAPRFYDKVSVSLIDYLHNNISTETWSFVPGGMTVFIFGGNKTGFRQLAEGETNPDPVRHALGIYSSFQDGPGITEDNMGYVEPYRIINAVLREGQADLTATGDLVERLANDEDSSLLTMDREVMAGSMPLFRKVIDAALSSPEFRKMLAWNQYCDTQWGPEAR